MVQFSMLLNIISPHLKKQHRSREAAVPSVTVEVMLAVTLRILAGASYLDVSWPYGIDVSTVYKVFGQTLDSLLLSLPILRFPQTATECVREAQRFRFMRRSPIWGVISAIDGIAIATNQPKKVMYPIQESIETGRDSLHLS